MSVNLIDYDDDLFKALAEGASDGPEHNAYYTLRDAIFKILNERGYSNDQIETRILSYL